MTTNRNNKYAVPALPFLPASLSHFISFTMSTSFATLGGAADPRLGKEAEAIPNRDDEPPSYSPGQYIGHNKNVTFEEYLYYADWTRSFEKTLSTSGRGIASIKTILAGKGNKQSPMEFEEPIGAPPVAVDAENTMQSFGVISDYEWHHASRAARTATWGAVFYLITTDILGPFSVPWAISQLGYGPGVALYLIFGVFAG